MSFILLFLNKVLKHETRIGIIIFCFCSQSLLILKQAFFCQLPEIWGEKKAYLKDLQISFKLLEMNQREIHKSAHV